MKNSADLGGSYPLRLHWKRTTDFYKIKLNFKTGIVGNIHKCTSSALGLFGGVTWKKE